MSEQSKSDLQAFGSGFLVFIGIVGIGGVLLIRSPRPTKPVAAAMPIDLDAVASKDTGERRAESPAPLIGAEDENEDAVAASDVDASGAEADSSPKYVSKGRFSPPRLKTTPHLDVSNSGVAATAVVTNTIDSNRTVKTADKTASPKLDLRGAGAPASASVRYGGNSRSELMGRGLGPVYNFKGGAGKGGSGAPGREVDGENAQIVDIQRRIEDSGLSDDQRTKFKKDIDEAGKTQ